MSRETFVNVSRGAAHAQVLSMVPVRIVEISPIVIAGSGGAIPYNSLNVYSRQGIPDIRNGDLLTDTVSGEQFRVSGTPFSHDQSFLKVQVEKVMVRTP